MSKNKDKILFIHPPQISGKGILSNLIYPPLGIAMLSSVLRNEGIMPFLYDANVERGDHFKKVFKLISDEEINIIGLSFTSVLAKSAYSFAERLKQEFPMLTIIAGGYHPTVLSDEVIRHPSIDYVVMGEGEITLPLLLKAILKKTGKLGDINGICYKHNGNIIKTEFRYFIANIDDIPIPAYDLLKLNRYSSLSSTRKPFVTVVRSRGCPFRCVFCGVDAIFSRRHRCQSPKRTIEELRLLVRQQKVREILFKDSDFLINRKNVEELCNLMLKERFDLVWSCNARVDRVDKDILDLMKKAGCNQITYGIESGSQRMLDVLKKDFKVEQIIEAVRLTKEQGIVCVGDFIIGAPGEDYESIAETISVIKKLNLDYGSFHFLTAFPGSALYEQAKKNNWFVDKDKIEFSGYEGVNINATKLSETELKKAMQLVIRSFYFDASYILKRLFKITPREIRNNFIGALGLLKKVLEK